MTMNTLRTVVERVRRLLEDDAISGMAKVSQRRHYITKIYISYFSYKGKTWIKITNFFTAALNLNIVSYGVFHIFFSFGTYRTVRNEFVLATINLMFETNGILISKCM